MADLAFTKEPVTSGAEVIGFAASHLIHTFRWGNRPESRDWQEARQDRAGHPEAA
jgi:hypothetical protein